MERDQTIGGALTVIIIKNHHISMLNYLDLPKMLLDLVGYRLAK